MNISLTTELEQFIQNQVASGKYNSNEEVILAGIRLLEERERIYKGFGYLYMVAILPKARMKF